MRQVAGLYRQVKEAGLVAHVALVLTLLAASDSELGYALAIFSGIMGISALLLFFLHRPRTS